MAGLFAKDTYDGVYLQPKYESTRRDSGGYPYHDDDKMEAEIVIIIVQLGKIHTGEIDAYDPTWFLKDIESAT